MEFEKTPEISSINYMKKSNLGSNVESRVNLKSAVQRRKHLAEAKCTEEACLRRGHSPKVNPKGAQACARRGGSMDFLMESEFMHWMSERMSFTNWVKADFHETSHMTLKFSAPPLLRERYRLGAGSSRYGNCFF